MSGPVRAALVGLLGLVACRSEPAPRKLPAFDGAVEVTALDTFTLHEDRDVFVGVSGVVAEAHDGRVIPLRDATGSVRVVVPDSVGLPVGTRFQARGALRRDAEGRLVEAHEWLYDSTAVPVRSP